MEHIAGDLTNADDRRIGGKNGFWRTERVQLAKQLLLEGQLFRHAFENDLRPLNALRQLVAKNNAANHLFDGGVVRLHSLQVAADGLRRSPGVGVDIINRHLHAAGGEDLRDTAAHQAAAEHRDPCKRIVHSHLLSPPCSRRRCK